ncbi:unnamed protein product [Lota lota]
MTPINESKKKVGDLKPSVGVRGYHNNKASDSQWAASEEGVGRGGTSWSGTSPYHHPQHHHHHHRDAAAADPHHHPSHHHHHHGQQPIHAGYTYCPLQPTGNSVISLGSSHQNSRHHNCQEYFQAFDPDWAGLGWAGLPPAEFPEL